MTGLLVLAALGFLVLVAGVLGLLADIRNRRNGD